MLYDRLSPEELLTKLIDAAAQAGHHAKREFYHAEQELHSDGHMYEVRELKELILEKLKAANPQEDQHHIEGRPTSSGFNQQF